MAWTAIILMLTIPLAPLAERVDLVEINHYHDRDGRALFTQVVTWVFRHEARRLHVRDWRMRKNVSIAVRRGEMVVTERRPPYKAWQSDVWGETWTQWDVEMADRKAWPKEMR